MTNLEQLERTKDLSADKVAQDMAARLIDNLCEFTKQKRDDFMANFVMVSSDGVHEDAHSRFLEGLNQYTEEGVQDRPPFSGLIRLTGGRVLKVEQLCYEDGVPFHTIYTGETKP